MNDYQREERRRVEDIFYRALLKCQAETGRDLSYKETITLASKMADQLEMK